ncbi:MAG: hypothetical protein IKE58_04335 [Blautia sp.]|nr:hypothetical protein [Blautia sp.]
MLVGMTYYQICSYFIIYSFFGWVVEVVFHAVRLRKVINRGFLNGPVCPVYGFGVILILAAINSLNIRTETSHQPVDLFLLFSVGVVLATLVELIGGFALDKIFHARWWDYSNQPFNFHGYICLKFSLIWGAGIVLVIKLLHPILNRASGRLMPERIGWWVLLVLYVFYLADLIVCVLVMLQLNQELKELDEIRASMRTVSNRMSMIIGEGTFAAQDALKDAKNMGEADSPYADSDEDPNLVETKEEFEEKKNQWIEEKDSLLTARKEAFEEKHPELSRRAQTFAQKRHQLGQAAAERKRQWKEEMEERKEKLAESVKESQQAMQEKLQVLQEKKEELRKRRDSWYQRLHDLNHLVMRFMLRNHPDLIHRDYDETLQEVLKHNDNPRHYEA